MTVVCMGNICRSPTGEAVMKAKAEQLGVSVEVDFYFSLNDISFPV